MNSIYTVGYGLKQIEEFVEVLKKYNIQYLIDVRSRPYSKYKPEFSKEHLKNYISKHAINYLFWGKDIGGQPDDRECYTEDGIVIYSKIEKKISYILAIEKLILNIKNGLNICLLCSEEYPEKCHRSKLIGETLSKSGISILHILDKNNFVEHKELRMKFLNNNLDFFGDKITSNKKYK